MPSIWDKGEALSYPRLTDQFEEGRPFTLLAMKETTPVNLDNDLDDVPVNVLTCQGAQQNDGAWEAYGDTIELGIISGPINELVRLAAADPDGDHFPVVVKWAKVQPKRTDRQAATVLQIVARQVKGAAKVKA